MSRVVGIILAASLAPISIAAAADAGPGAHRVSGQFLGHASEHCRGPDVYTSHYSEQVCYRGAAGYAACRWVDRTHDVEVPDDCAPRHTIEQARPADRGAFPPHPSVAPRART